MTQVVSAAALCERLTLMAGVDGGTDREYS